MKGINIMTAITSIRKNQGNGIVTVMLDVFRAQSWKFEELEENALYRLKFRLGAGSCNLYAKISPNDGQVLFQSIIDTQAPAGRRLAIAELFARINYRLSSGSFDLDFKDGEISYRTSINLEDGLLTQKMARTLVLVNLSSLDAHLETIMKVIYGGMEPEDALGLSEL